MMGGSDWVELLVPTHKKMSEKRSMAVTPAETSKTVLFFSISFFMILCPSVKK
jgi:hypothetical protein